MIIRPLAALVLAAALSGAAFAAGSSAPFGYQPDPALKTASLADLQRRVRDTCASTQARIQASTAAAMSRPCGCYAQRVMRALEPGELDAYRNTGVFNDTARAKALVAIDQCKLQRPI